MKKTSITLVAIGFLACATCIAVHSNAQAAEQELRPMQKAMQARAGWVKSMNENLAASKLGEVQKDALALASQTKAVAEKQQDPLAKELTLKVSTLASATGEAAGKNDGETVKKKLADIKAACAECHAKIRDKK